MRDTLVAALVACADRPNRVSACRFLVGLSADELQFIAEYLGARILHCQAGDTAGSIRFDTGVRSRVSADRELKMILLREYLRRAGVQGLPSTYAPFAVN